MLLIGKLTGAAVLTVVLSLVVDWRKALATLTRPTTAPSGGVRSRHDERPALGPKVAVPAAARGGGPNSIGSARYSATSCRRAWGTMRCG